MIVTINITLIKGQPILQHLIAFVTILATVHVMVREEEDNEYN